MATVRLRRQKRWLNRWSDIRAGEAPACAPVPAISQAVYNAIGVWLDIPMTPERVLMALGKV